MVQDENILEDVGPEHEELLRNLNSTLKQRKRFQS